MSTRKKRFKINFFDIVIILIVIILAIGAYVFTHRGETAQQTKKITYVVELRALPTGFSELIKKGDKLTDNVKNYYMGNVVKAEVVPYLSFSNDIENGIVKETPVEGMENVIITVEADAFETESDFKLNSGFIIKGGLEANVKGPGYAGSGFILQIER